VGFAVALQKPVWGYAADAGTLLDRVRAGVDADGEALDARGYVVENFGLPINLMLACSVRLVTGGAEECLAGMAEADRRRAARRAQALQQGGPED
jgi:nucleoside deoxyribosyltransferase